MFEQKKQEEVALTDLEKEVLKLFAEENTTQEIADILFLCKHSIESYRKNQFQNCKSRIWPGLPNMPLKWAFWMLDFFVNLSMTI